MAWAKRLQSTVKWIAIVLAFLFALFLLHQCVLPVLALLFPQLDPSFFDLAVFKAYPAQHYATFDIPGPMPRQLKWDERCKQGLVFMTPNGPSIDRPGPMIVDAKGELVWASSDFRVAANLQVQEWKGEKYLTLWSGEKAATSGKGVYMMIDSAYEIVKVITAIGENLFGDLHEFKITEAGTGLLTVYNTTRADLTGLGMGHGPGGWVVDNLFQEIDLETGDLLFQWRASDYFNPVDTYMIDLIAGRWETAPLDWFHINSVDKDSQGNYLISSRHFHSVMCISQYGKVMWTLGGRDNEFKDLSDGQATNFKWQHDARWLSEKDGILTLFDNGKAGPLHVDATYSRAMFIQLDIPNRTAKLVQSLASQNGILASSQGSAQVLPEIAQTFVGWGSAAAYSEYSSEGELLCETHLAAAWSFRFERFKSYRISKSLDWHANPKEPPQAKIVDNALYVSWNGATEVAHWSLDMCVEEELQKQGLLTSDVRDERNHDGSSGAYQNIGIIPRTSFESAFDLSMIPAEERSHARYRVAALDKEHQTLRYSDIILQDDAEITTSSSSMLVFKLFLFIGIGVGTRSIFKHHSSRRRAHSQNDLSLTLPAWVEQNPRLR